MRKILFFTFIIYLSSCQYKRDKNFVESDESQILNLALDKAVGSDTTFRNWLKHNPPAKPIIRSTGKIDSVAYLKSIHWGDSIIKILDTASLFVVVHKKHEGMAMSFVNNIHDTIQQNKSATIFNEVLKILCDQNLSKDTTDISLLKPKYNFKIYEESALTYDPIRKIGSISFSKIAFNKQKDMACIYTSFGCGHFCGKGEIHFFIKKDSKWMHVTTKILRSTP